MKRFRLALSAAALSLALAPAIARADAFGYETFVVATDTGQATESRVAARSDHEAVAAWRDSQGNIWTRALEDGLLLGAVSHGPGHDPAILFSEFGCHLAFARDNQVVVRLSPDGTQWDAPLSLSTGAGVPTAHPDLGAYLFGAIVPGKAGDRDLSPVYLSWQEGGTHIVFASLGSGGWSAPVVVCTDGWGGNSAYPQVEPRLVGGEVLPRLYYLNSATFSLGYRDFNGVSWSAPVFPPSLEWIGDQYDVAVGPDYRHQVLGMAPPPACPCNSISYIEETPSGWSDRMVLTVYLDFFNWPQYASLAVGGFGSRHAFWYEAVRTADFQWVTEDMFWTTRTNGAWFDGPSGFFGDRVGTWTDVAADPVGSAAFFTWVEAVSGGTEVILRSPIGGGSEAPDVAANGPASVSIAPNPARDISTLGFAQPPGVPARVELFDTAGRLVRVYDAPGNGGITGRIAWDGRDGEGRAVPAGVYLAKVSAAGSVGRALVVRLN